MAKNKRSSRASIRTDRRDMAYEVRTPLDDAMEPKPRTALAAWWRDDAAVQAFSQPLPQRRPR